MFKNRLIVFIVLIVLIYLLISSIKSVFQIKNAGKLVLDYEKEAQVEEKKNQELKQRLTEVQKPEFIEKVAREKLGMGKPGESVVIMPKITLIPKKEATGRSLENWEKWWQLFN